MSDLDNEELEATRKLNGIDKENEIEVGDRITYVYKYIDLNKVVTEIVTHGNLGSSGINWFKERLENGRIEIIKIERPKYEVVEEKKELLTKEEKEFLKDMCKYYDINSIFFYNNYVTLKKNDIHQLSPWYPENLKFANVEKCKAYTLKELGLEE